jgi:hypothetical protein
MIEGLNFKRGVRFAGIDGIKKIFVIPQEIIPDSEEIIFNTGKLDRGIGYTILGRAITLSEAPQIGDDLFCNYIAAGDYGINRTSTFSLSTIYKTNIELTGIKNSINCEFYIPEEFTEKTERITSNLTQLTRGVGYAIFGRKIMLAVPPNADDPLTASYLSENKFE